MPLGDCMHSRLMDTKKAHAIMAWIKEALVAVRGGAEIYSIRTHKLIHF